MAADLKRPGCKRNDCVGWINRARLQATENKRLGQMLAGPEKGRVYMTTAHRPSRKARASAGQP